MAEDIERAETRLDNIRSVEPILGALRTISHGSWQLALRKRAQAQRYSDQMLRLIAQVLPSFATLPDEKEPPEKPKRILALIIGSERGLCGRFNIDLFDYYSSYTRKQEAKGIQTTLWTLGSRIERRLRQYGHTPEWSQSLPTSSMPSSRLVFDVAQLLLGRYESGAVDAVDVLYNSALGVTRFRSGHVRLIPPAPIFAEEKSPPLPWPSPIIESDPRRLFQKMLEQSIALQFYKVLLDSAVAEHATRYQLMDDATQNTKRLTEELLRTLQMARRHAITEEMQGLAVSSGLLKK